MYNGPLLVLFNKELTINPTELTSMNKHSQLRNAQTAKKDDELKAFRGTLTLWEVLYKGMFEKQDQNL